MQFFVENLKTLRKECGTQDGQHLAQVAGAKWQTLSSEEKAAYKERYVDTRPPVVFKNATVGNLVAARRAETLAVLRATILINRAGRPKRIPCAYAFFVSHCRNSDKFFGDTSGEILKNIAVLWKGMSALQRQPFLEQSIEARRKGEQQIEEWMAKIGNDEKLSAAWTLFQFREKETKVLAARFKRVDLHGKDAIEDFEKKLLALLERQKQLKNDLKQVSTQCTELSRTRRRALAQLRLCHISKQLKAVGKNWLRLEKLGFRAARNMTRSSNKRLMERQYRNLEQCTKMWDGQMRLKIAFGLP